MALQKATKYQEYLEKARAASESRLALLREENSAYNNILPGTESEGAGGWSDYADDFRSPTQSRYLSPDYHLAVDTYAEAMLYNFPSFEFEGNDLSWSKEEVDALNGVFKKIAFANNLPYKMMSVLRAGIRKGCCVCELVPSKMEIVRYIMVNGKAVPDKTVNTGLLDLIRYIPSQTFIDPNADPDDVRNTASYCIVGLGFFSKQIYNEMAEKNGWLNDKVIEEVNVSSFYDDSGEEQEKNIEGVRRETGIKVAKLFTSDGRVQVVVNDEYVVFEGLNAKGVCRMPLIFYKSLPGGSTPYGRLLWLVMKRSVMALSVATNLILDNIGKNLSGPIFTTIRELAEENINDFENGEIRYIRSADTQKRLEDQILRLKFEDMTAGAQFALAKFENDVQRISRLDSLSQGSQGQQQIRTNYIAQMLSQPSVNQKSAFVKQAEFTFFQEFGRDMLDILYAFYDDFKDIRGVIPREKLRDIRNVRVRQGSTLEEDSMSQAQKLKFALDLVLATNEDGFSADKLMTDMFKAIGIYDPEWYKLPLEEMLMKAFMKAGYSPDEAQRATIETVNRLNEGKRATNA